MTSRWRFEWIEGHEATSSPTFVARWQSLVDRSSWVRVFQEPIVARAWITTKGAALGATPSFCWGVSDCGSEAMIPFSRMPSSWRNTWRRRLVAVGEPHFDYQNSVGVMAEREPGLWDSFWAGLADELRQVGQWEHAMVLRQNLEHAAKDAKVDAWRESPYIALTRYESLSDYLASRGRRHRENVRRKLRSLAKLGRLGVRTYGPQEGVAAHAELQRLRKAYETKWAGTPSCDLFAQPGTFEFYERMLDWALPVGLVHFSVLNLDWRAISWHFGFLHRGVLHYYKFPFDLEFEAYSPGKVHLAQLIDLGIQQGWTEIDLGGGTESYKYHWTDTTRKLVQWEWQAPTWRNRACRCIRRTMHAMHPAR